MRGLLSLLFFFSFILCTLAQTTPFINQVFVGKCYEKNPSGVNCTDLWITFSQAAQKSNYIVNDEDYAPFFNNTDFSTPENGILFWSGNQAFALSISNTGGQRFTTVEGTSTGYILNGLSWCGTTENTFDYTDPCLYPSNNTYYGTQGVWAKCSHFFAEGAHGNITILLEPSQINYNSGPYLAYRNTSVFYTVELPSMIPSKINNITILLLANKTLAPDEFCGKGSLVNLNNDIFQKFGYTPKCIDNPKDIYNILCPPESATTPECVAATMTLSEISNYERIENSEKTYLIWALVVTVCFAATLVIAVHSTIRARRLEKNYSPL